MERLRRVDHNTLTDEQTIEDPKAYTKTWNATIYFELNPDWDIGEFVCQEMLAAGHK